MQVDSRTSLLKPIALEEDRRAGCAEIQRDHGDAFGATPPVEQDIAMRRHRLIAAMDELRQHSPQHDQAAKAQPMFKGLLTKLGGLNRMVRSRESSSTSIPGAAMPSATQLKFR